MGKMTNHMVEKSFETAKKRYLGKITLQEAVENLEKIGVNPFLKKVAIELKRKSYLNLLQLSQFD